MEAFLDGAKGELQYEPENNFYSEDVFKFMNGELVKVKNFKFSIRPWYINTWKYFSDKDSQEKQTNTTLDKKSNKNRGRPRKRECTRKKRGCPRKKQTTTGEFIIKFGNRKCNIHSEYRTRRRIKKEVIKRHWLDNLKNISKYLTSAKNITVVKMWQCNHRICNS